MVDTRPMKLAALVIAALTLAAAAPDVQGDVAKAKQLNNAGMKAYKQQEYEEAKKLFEQAIAEDAGFVKAHYNRASMAALLGDTAVVADEFAWLRASKSPEAARVLAKSRTDRDFEGLSLHDAGRAAIGKRPLADTPLAELVLEHDGYWNGVDEGMAQGWWDLRFLKGGKFKGREHSGDSGEWYGMAGTWTVKDRTVTLRRGRTNTQAFTLGSCGSRTEAKDSFCLMTEDQGIALFLGRYRDSE